MKIGWSFSVLTCCCLLLGVAGQHTDGDGIPTGNQAVQTTTTSTQDTSAPLPVRLDVSGDPPQDSDSITTSANLLSTSGPTHNIIQTSTGNPAVETANPTSNEQPILDTVHSTQDVNETNAIRTDSNDTLNSSFNQTKSSTIIVTTFTTGSTPIPDIFTQVSGRISTVKPRHVKNNAETTTAMPDLTRTSQSIVLVNNSSSISNTSTSPHVPEVSSDSTSHSTPNINNDSSSDFSNQSSIDTITSSENETDFNATSSSEGVTPETFTPASEKPNLTLTFNGTCDENDSIQTQLQNLMGIDTSNSSSCQSTITVTVNVQNSSETARLQNLIGRAQLDVEGTNFTLVAVNQISEVCPVDNSGFVNIFSGIFLTSRETVTYAVVGAIFGFAILVIIALLCCKCWCRRKNQTMDDIPHLTMRLEDYSLTRIPRPSTIYNDGRTNGYTNGVDRPSPSQPFDTSVVPMEEAPTIYGLRRDLQSFNSKRYRQRTVELEEDLYSRGGSVLAGSTERLARDSGSGRRGAENPTFRF